MKPFCNVNKIELKVFKIKYYGTIDYLQNQQKHIRLTVQIDFGTLYNCYLGALLQTAIDNDKEYYH